MASTNKTPLGLNQWVESDKPKMEDFNHDNQLVEAVLSQKANMSDIVQLQSQKADNTLVDHLSAELTRKADIAVVESGLALKPDRTEVYSKAESEIQFVGRNELPNLDVLAINEALTTKVDLPSDPIGLTLLNGASTYYWPLQYRKQGELILISGNVKGIQIGVVSAMLPVGFRPMRSSNMVIPLTEGTTPGFAHLTVRSNGEILIERASISITSTSVLNVWAVIVP